jgi:hypothetical protein
MLTAPHFCAEKSIQGTAVTALNVVRSPRNSCLSAEKNIQKFEAALFLDFCAKLSQKCMQPVSSISVHCYCCTACPESIQYGPVLAVPASSISVPQACLGIRATSRKLASLLKLDFSLSYTLQMLMKNEEWVCTSFPNSTQGGNVKSHMI